MDLVDETVGGALVIQTFGRLDSGTAPAFEKHLVERLEQGVQALVIDFGPLDYISSAGLRVLLMTAKRIKQSNGRMAMCNLSDSIHQVLEISGFLTILTVCSDRDEAVVKVTD